MNLVGICNIATAIAAIIHKRRIPPHLVCQHNEKNISVYNIYAHAYIISCICI